MSAYRPKTASSQFDRVDMRPLTPRDIDMVYHWAVEPSVAKTWKYRGSTPPPDVFANDLWSGVLAQYLVTRASDGEEVALVSVYNANLNSGRAHIACLASPKFVRSGLPVLGVGLLMVHAFDTWPLKKLYMETSSIALRQFSSVIRGGLISEEARLVDYEMFGNERADLVYLAAEREQFLKATQRYSDVRSSINDDDNVKRFDVNIDGQLFRSEISA